MEPLTVAMNWRVAEGVTVVEAGETLTVTGAAGAGCIVTVADAVELGLATLAARTVTAATLGTLAGAVYSPEAEIVPVAALPPIMPLTLQVTPWFVEPETVALNWRVVVAATLALAGVIDTLMGAAAVMLRFCALVVTAPTPVFVTVTGRDVPACAAVAVPMARRPVAER